MSKPEYSSLYNEIVENNFRESGRWKLNNMTLLKQIYQFKVSAILQI